MTEICDEHRKFMMDVVERLARMETLLQSATQTSKAEILACQGKHHERFKCIERDVGMFESQVKAVGDTQRRLGWMLATAAAALIIDLVFHVAKGGW